MDSWYEEENNFDEDDYSIVDYNITSSPNDFNIMTLCNFIDVGIVKLPAFQRNYVWDIRSASKLIESIVIGLPIPQLFLYEKEKNKFLVIDGQQRLLSIYFFVKQKFPTELGKRKLREILTSDDKFSDAFFSDDTLSKSDRLIVKLYAAGVGQKQIAKAIDKTQSYISKRLERLLDLIEAERLNDVSRTKKEIEFELAWEKFIYSHKMPKDVDVILETFNYLIGERMYEELLIYFYSFREYYRYAYRLLYIYEYNPNEDNLGRINELPLIFRKIFYYQKLDEQADVFIWLYYRLVTEMERRKKITPEPNQAVYEQLIDEQEKTAKRVKMTSEQFMEERFIPKVAPLLKKRTDDFLQANNVYAFDENADIEAELKKLFGDPK